LVATEVSGLLAAVASLSLWLAVRRQPVVGVAWGKRLVSTLAPDM
jgi:hypothetical protein